MSHYGAHQGAINSGAINHVSFPGAEEGLSLIDLTGTVEVVCALSAIRLRLTASATTTASANGSTPGTNIRAQLAAVFAPTAVTSAGVLTKIAALPDAQIASAVPQVTGALRFVAGATTTGAASSTAGSYVRTTRSASTSATGNGAVMSRSLIPRAASTSAVATTTSSALRYRRTPASTVAFASGVATTRVRFRLGAPTSGTATASTPTLRIKVRRSASTSAVATPTPAAFAIKGLIFPAPQAASAVAASIAARQLCATAGSTDASAQGSSGIALLYQLGATIQGSMISTAAAADYGITQAAPTERLMIVPASDRRMEVTL